MKHYIKSYLWENSIKFDIQRNMKTYQETIIVRPDHKEQLITFLKRKKVFSKVQDKINLSFITIK
jgi:hypothetical protein